MGSLSDWGMGWLKKAVALLFCAVLIISPSVAAASTGSPDTRAQESGPQVDNVELRDIDGDGAPDMAMIRGSFITDHDLLTVYDDKGDMPTSEDWRELLHFDHATLVFDAGEDGHSELVIFFGREGDRRTALLYDDRNGDGQVSYQVNGKQVEITEPGDSGEGEAHPTVRAEAAGPWLSADGYAQGNVRFLIDGFVPQQMAATYPQWLQDSYFPNDGVIDFEVEVVDSDNDGNPEYDVARLVRPLPDYYEPVRTVIHRREGSGRTRAPEGFLFWPFLGHAPWYEGAGFLGSPPTIDVDWTTGRIRYVGLWGYPIESGWFVKSFLDLKKGQTNETNHETPMAYYDLAENGDGRPELHVRVLYQVPYGVQAPSTSYGEANEEIRYTWAQTAGADISWDYKLGLFGRHAITTEVPFSDFRIRTVPYAELPSWVVQNQWDAAMFVAREGRPYYTSEGIYAGSPLGPPANKRYLLGASVDPPAVTPDLVDDGWRGEYTWNLGGRPELYLSSVDRKLHLKGARKGFWKVSGSGSIMEYESLAGTYIDRWTLSEDGVATESLYASDEFLVYADSRSRIVRVLRADVAPAAFETLPPTDPVTWRALGQQLQQYARELPPDNLAAWLDQFEGEEAQVTGALLHDYRITPQGFRFILELQPGFDVPLDQGGLAPLLGAPGSYVVAYDGKAWSVRPAAPAALRVDDLQVNPQEGELVALGWTTVEAIVRNTGLEDVRDLPACATLTGPADHREVLTTTLSLLPGEGSQRLAWDWAPAAAGTWTARIETGCGPGFGAPAALQTANERIIQVAPAPGPDPRWLLSLGGRIPGTVFLILAGAVLLTGGITFLWTREFSSRP